MTHPSDSPKRCDWASTGGALDVEYHDTQWGLPTHDDRTLFEFLILEGAQAGLSWTTILKKREGYRRSFSNFDAAKVARYDRQRIERLLRNEGIIRNRLKIESAVSNAKAFLEIQQQFDSFDAYIWRFVDGKPIRNAWKRADEVPSTTPISEAMSKDLKKRGFRFVGSTICYAFMQAIGMVNDHLVDCFRYQEIPAVSTGS